MEEQNERMLVMQRCKDPLQDRNSYDRFWVKKNLSLSQAFSKETMRQWNRPRRANRSNKQGVGILIKNLRGC